MHVVEHGVFITPDKHSGLEPFHLYSTNSYIPERKKEGIAERFDFMEVFVEGDPDTFRQAVAIVSIKDEEDACDFVVIAIDLEEIHKNRHQKYLPYSMYNYKMEKRSKRIALTAFDIELILRPTCMVPVHGHKVKTTLTNRWNAAHEPLYWSFPFTYMDRSNWNSLPAQDLADMNEFFNLDEHESDDFNAGMEAPGHDINLESDSGDDEDEIADDDRDDDKEALSDESVNS